MVSFLNTEDGNFLGGKMVPVEAGKWQVWGCSLIKVHIFEVKNPKTGIR